MLKKKKYTIQDSFVKISIIILDRWKNLYSIKWLLILSAVFYLIRIEYN